MQRLRNIRRALISFGWVALAFAVYSVGVAPFVDHNREDEADVPEPEVSEERASDRYVRELAPLFPAGSWELDRPKVLRSQQATILLKELEQQSDDSLQIRPCTLVFYGSDRDRKDSSRRGPIILQALEGAILKFDKPIDLNRGEIGKPVGGQLVGNVRIFSAGGKDSDDLELTTRNVIITDQRIWTREAVTFRLGNNYGIGQDLMIERAEPVSSDSKPKEDWLAGLGIIQLHRLERLTLQMAGGDMFDSINAQSPQRPSSPTGPAGAATMELRCDGPLRFDLSRMLATVEQNVRITRQQIGQPTDTMRANQLTMQMARVDRQPRDQDQRRPTADTTKQSGAKQTLAVTRIIAVGQPLVIDAPSRQAYLESKRLEYDFETKRIKLRGFNPFASKPKLDQTGQHTGQVEFRSPQHSIVAPAIDFLVTADRASWRMVAEGPGRYVGVLNEQGQKVSASWKQQLSIAPEQGEQVLRIAGNGQVRAPQLGAIQSELIELWIRHESIVVAQRIDGTQIKETKSTPTKLVTAGRAGEMTWIDSPQFSGQLAGMTIFFTQAADTVAPRDSTAPEATRGRTLHAARDQPGRNSKYRIEGGALTAWVDTSQQQVQRVVVRGQTRLVEETTAQQPFELAGNLIDYRTDENGKPIALLQGKPATFRAPEMQMTGETIQVRGHENYIAIPGAGAVRMKVAREFAHDRPPMSGRASATRSVDLELDWKGSMQFNGQVATVRGDVSATSIDLDVRTVELQVTLEEPLDFSTLGGLGHKPQIRYVTATGGVLAASKSRDDNGQLSAYQQIATRDFEFDYQTGEAKANGPGWLAVTTPGAGAPGLGFGMAAPRQSTSSPQLMQLSVAFTSLLQGNLHHRECRLTDDIRCWYGPVQNWEDRVDPVLVDNLSENEYRMTCRELLVMESPTAVGMTTGRKPIELLARGETYVESQRYAAKGHQIKFAEDKGMLTLEGDARRPAELWQRNLTSGASSHSGRARRIRYWPETGQLEVDGGLGIDLSQVPVDAR